MSTDSPVILITDPAELSIGVVCASFNSDLCESLLTRVTSCLQEKELYACNVCSLIQESYSRRMCGIAYVRKW